MRNNIQKVISELKSRLKRIYGKRLYKILLYGSWARGEAKSASDIDILVILNGPVHPGKEIGRMGEYIAEISLRHDVVLSCFYISKERYFSEKSPLVLNIHREGVAI